MRTQKILILLAVGLLFVHARVLKKKLRQRIAAMPCRCLEPSYDSLDICNCQNVFLDETSKCGCQYQNTYEVINSDLANCGRVPAIKMPILPIANYEAIPISYELLPAINLPEVCSVLPSLPMNELPCPMPMTCGCIDTCKCKMQSPILELPPIVYSSDSCIQEPICMPQVFPSCTCQNMPCTCLDTLNTCLNLPCTCQNVPCSCQKTPCSCQTMPCSCQIMPCSSCQTMPCSCQTMTCSSCQTMPCSCQKMPCSCQDIPCSCPSKTCGCVLTSYQSSPCSCEKVPCVCPNMPCACQKMGCNCPKIPRAYQSMLCGCQKGSCKCQGCDYLSQLTALELPCSCQSCQSPIELPVYSCGCQSLPSPIIGCGGKYLRQVKIQPPFL